MDGVNVPQKKHRSFAYKNDNCVQTKWEVIAKQTKCLVIVKIKKENMYPILHSKYVFKKKSY